MEATLEKAREKVMEQRHGREPAIWELRRRLAFRSTAVCVNKQPLLLAVAILLLIALCAWSGENLNGIYLGEFPMEGTGPIVVQITEDGTVIAWRNRVVPLMHDRYGKEVRIKRVELR